MEGFPLFVRRRGPSGRRAPLVVHIPAARFHEERAVHVSHSRAVHAHRERRTKARCARAVEAESDHGGEGNPRRRIEDQRCAARGIGHAGAARRVVAHSYARRGDVDVDRRFGRRLALRDRDSAGGRDKRLRPVIRTPRYEAGVVYPTGNCKSSEDAHHRERRHELDERESGAYCDAQCRGRPRAIEAGGRQWGLRGDRVRAGVVLRAGESRVFRDRKTPGHALAPSRSDVCCSGSGVHDVAVSHRAAR